MAAGSDSDWNPNGEYDNIFYIANAKDLVSLIPGAAGNVFFDKREDNWGKFGKSYWFAENGGYIEIDLATHELSVYLDYLRNEFPISTYKPRADLNIERTNKILDFGSNLIKFPTDVNQH